MGLENNILQVKNETSPGANSANRIGSVLQELNSAKRDKSDSLSKSETIDMVNAVKIIAATGTPFLGTIEPSTTIPAGDFWAFAGEGTYANAGGIVVGAGEIAIITRVGTTFDSVILDVPVRSIDDIEKTSTVGLVDTYTITYTDDSTPTTFEVTNGENSIFEWESKPYNTDSLVIRYNKIYRAKEDTLSTDFPGTSSKWSKLIIGDIENVLTPINMGSLLDPTTSNIIYFNNYEVYTGKVSKFITNGTGTIQIHKANADYSEVSFIDSIILGNSAGIKEINIDVDLVDERIGVSASGGTLYYGAPQSGDVQFAESPNYNLSNAIILGYGYSYLEKGLESRVKQLEENSGNSALVLHQKNKLKFQKSKGNFLTAPNAYFMGRWFEKQINGEFHVCTVNQGAEFYVWVRGTTQLTGLFTNISSSGNTPVVSVSINGGDFTRITIASSVSLASGLSTDDNLIRIVVSGLQESDNKWVDELGLAFKGFTVNSGGSFLAIEPKNRNIQFYGDSITEGINVLGTGANPTVNCAEKAFPFIASDLLNCANVRVGFGGSGVTHGGSGQMPKMLTVISLMTFLRFENAQSPDILVVNHGTNDTGALNFTPEYQDAIDKLMRNFPDVPIFCMRPFNGSFASEIQSVVDGYGASKNVWYVDTTGWGVTYTDGVHPDVAGGQIAGEKLADFILSKLGKQFFIA